MSVNPKVAQLINDHIPHELLAHHTYLRMSLDANRLGLFGIEAWFIKQSSEERDHMIKFLTYLNDFDAPSAVPAAVAIPPRYDNPLSMFNDALDLERQVTARIGALRSAALEAGDDGTFQWLSWATEEQTKSEIELGDILNRLTKVTGDQLLEFDEWISEL